MSVAPDKRVGDARWWREWRPDCDVETLRARARTLADVRAYFAATGALEVDTPVLSAATVTDPGIESFRVQAPESRGDGGTWYLQTSPEFHMKRLLAAGAPSIYRIGPVFRHEEQGRLHNPEFTMIEWYRLGFDLTALMADVRALVDSVLGQGCYSVTSYRALLQRSFALDPIGASRRSLERAVARLPAPPAPGTLGDSALIDLLFSAAVDGLGQGRVFVTEFPPAQAALARCRRDDEGSEVADRFELIVDGVEIANGYQELQDAFELERRMGRDQALRRYAGATVPDRDERLLAAMRHGLPACAGVALGFERLLLRKLEKTSIADVMPFSFERS
jgi:elongation factor P--(R)-beta-lysine ligase